MSERNPFSASQLARRELCPGSYYMEDGLPEEASPEATAGTRIHAAVATAIAGDERELEQLSDSERDISTRWLSAARAYVEGATVWAEVPLELRDGDSVATTGTCDVLGYADGEVRVADLKTGYGELDAAGLSWQLSVYVAMAMQRSGAARGVGFVYQPALERRYEISIDRDRVPDIVSEVRGVIERAKALPIELRPSPAACRYCRARHFCAGPRSMTSELAVAEQRELSPRALGALMQRWKIAKACGEALEAHVRVLAAEGTPGLGWYLRSTPGDRYVISTLEAFARLRDVMDAERFLALATVRVTRLEEEYVRRTLEEHGSKAAAKRAFAALLRGVVARAPDKQRLTEME